MEKKIAGRLDMDAYQTKTCKWSHQKDAKIPDPHIHTKVYFYFFD
jgi:hypothetical protein